MSESDTLTDEEYESVRAFDEGMAAQQDGKKRSDCPYAPDTSKRREWVKGFEVMVPFDENPDRE